MSRSSRLSIEAPVWGPVLALAAGTGLVCGVSPKYGLAAALGIAFAITAFADLTRGLVIFACVSFLEALNGSAGGGAASFMKIAGLLLFGSWYLGTLDPDRRAALRPRSVPPVFLIGCGALLTWSAMSVAWAETNGAAATATYRYALNMLLFPIVLASVRRREHLVWVLGGFVTGAVISTLYGFLNPASSANGDFGRLTGAVGDSNEQAAVLVAAIPLAIALMVGLRGRPVLRILSGLAALLCLAGVVNTLSRGGLIALAMSMVAAMFFGGQWRRWAVAAVVITAVGTVGYFIAIAPNSARNRVSSGDTSGRSDIWTVGWRMVQAHPLLGVGSGNFQAASIHYVQAPGTLRNANLIVDVPHVAHNTYLEELAEIGVPGLLAFLTIVAAAVASAARAAWLFERAGLRDLEFMARALAIGLVGFLTADFFLSGEFSKQLWLLLALGPATLALAYAEHAQSTR